MRRFEAHVRAGHSLHGSSWSPERGKLMIEFSQALFVLLLKSRAPLARLSFDLIGYCARLARANAFLPAVLAAVLVAPYSAKAQEATAEIKNGVAIFAALDKVTARISELSIKVDQTMPFRALKVTPRACFSRAPTLPPLTLAYVEVDEIKLDGSSERLFTGWMIAESPGINSVEHPVYDVWLTGCAEPLNVAPAKAGGARTGVIKRRLKRRRRVVR